MTALDPRLTEAAVTIGQLKAELAAAHAAFAELREKHSTMSVQWTRAKQDRARLMAALERAKPYVQIESARPTILPVVPAITDLAMIDALLAEMKGKSG